MDYEKQFEQKAENFLSKLIDNPVKMIMFSVVMLGVIGFGITLIGGFFSTASTVVSAPGRVLNKTLETNNIIQSYEWFYDVNASYIARLGQVNQFKGLLNDESDADEKRRLRIDMSAMQQTCRDLATKYNANSQKMNKSIFKGWELPAQLEVSECG